MRMCRANVPIFYNSGKSKGGKGTSGSHALHVDYQDAMDIVNIEQYWTELEKLVNDQRKYFIQHITVR